MSKRISNSGTSMRFGRWREGILLELAWYVSARVRVKVRVPILALVLYGTPMRLVERAAVQLSEGMRLRALRTAGFMRFDAAEASTSGCHGVVRQVLPVLKALRTKWKPLPPQSVACYVRAHRPHLTGREYTLDLSINGPSKQCPLGESGPLGCTQAD